MIVVCTKQSRAERARRALKLERLGCEILARSARNGMVPLDDLLDQLGRRNMTNVMVEGGGRVMGSFFDQKLADEARVFVSPTLTGGRKAPGPLNGAGDEEWPPPLAKDRVRVRQAGRDGNMCGTPSRSSLGRAFATDQATARPSRTRCMIRRSMPGPPPSIAARSGFFDESTTIRLPDTREIAS